MNVNGNKIDELLQNNESYKNVSIFILKRTSFHTQMLNIHSDSSLSLPLIWKTQHTKSWKWISLLSSHFQNGHLPSSLLTHHFVPFEIILEEPTINLGARGRRMKENKVSVLKTSSNDATTSNQFFVKCLLFLSLYPLTCCFLS